MVADIKREIQKAYGIEHPDEGVALRGSFLIDANGIVRHQVVNDLPLGRNIDEMLRMVDALQFHEEHGEVCPAQWEKRKRRYGRLSGRRCKIPDRKRFQPVIGTRFNKRLAQAGLFVSGVKI